MISVTQESKTVPAVMNRLPSGWATPFTDDNLRFPVFTKCSRGNPTHWSCGFSEQGDHRRWQSSGHQHPQTHWHSLGNKSPLPKVETQGLQCLTTWSKVTEQDRGCQGQITFALMRLYKCSLLSNMLSHLPQQWTYACMKSKLAKDGENEWLMTRKVFKVRSTPR